ncbi:DUF4302 domain-containing protein [Flavobacterium sp. NKUCC04_CG]|uniref:DUF4302 domain-containing protein n=1 Tax=Flavobacterium sp. NKUCC04_CG TaxID=2842121 RepID=UPI001C5BBE56|nr:DUF4302 domain-containing protein [Flavobacterium sp. NKUCC04_CG]MBW3517850.1 DUF4302 domain-containing protein [Flavobacterium sp. NKUCC04_CG]
MKRFKYIAVLFLAISGSVFTSCNSDDSSVGIDGVDASTRLKEAEKKLQAALLSAENGWIVEFFPNNKLLGGYQMWMDFNENGSVQVRSDRNFDDTSIQNDEYNFVLLSTIALSFPTGSVVHEFIKDNEMTNHADIEFLIDKYEEGKIIFKGHTSRNTIVFTAATAEEKQFDLSKNKQMFLKFDGPQTTMFKSLIVNDGGNLQKYALDYNGSSRFGLVSSEDGTPLNKEGGIGFGYTATGLVVSPAINVGGELVKFLDYNAGSDEFIGTASTGTVTVKNLQMPLFVTDDYRAFLAGKDVAHLESSLRGVSVNSMLFNKVMMEYFKSVGYGETGSMLERIDISFNGNNSAIQYSFLKGKAPILRRVRLSSGADGRLIFTNVSVNGTLPAELQVIDDALIQSAGFFVKREGQTGEYGNPAFSITSASQIKIKFAVYGFN